MRAFVLGALSLVLVGPSARADDWPQYLGPKRDGVWRETGIVENLPPDGPKVAWRAPLAEGYAGPAVAGGRVYVTDWLRDPSTPRSKNPFQKTRQPGTERVWCLDEATGKMIWK